MLALGGELLGEVVCLGFASAVIHAGEVDVETGGDQHADHHQIGRSAPEERGNHGQASPSFFASGAVVTTRSSMLSTGRPMAISA